MSKRWGGQDSFRHHTHHHHHGGLSHTHALLAACPLTQLASGFVGAAAISSAAAGDAGGGAGAGLLNPLCVLGAVGLGVSLVQIHIYVDPLKKALQVRSLSAHCLCVGEARFWVGQQYVGCLRLQTDLANETSRLFSACHHTLLSTLTEHVDAAHIYVSDADTIYYTRAGVVAAGRAGGAVRGVATA